MSSIRHQPLGPAEPGDSDDAYSDNENSPLTQEIYGGSQRTVLQETNGWDVFRDPPQKVDSGSMANQACLEMSVKILKVIAYIITFAVVLSGGVISKSLMLFMTSQIRKDRELPYCNRDLGRDKHFVAVLPDEERVAWMWAILIAFAVPEVGALIRAVRICFFKSWRVPLKSHFLFVFAMESMHTIGLALLMFVVLPEIDAIKGAMLTNCLCLIPGVFGLLSRSSKEGRRAIKVLFDLVAICAQVSGLVVWPLLENKPSLYLIPVATVLTSCGWWENFVCEHSPIGIVRSMGRVKREMVSTRERVTTRYFTCIFMSVWKLMLFFIALCVIMYYQGDEVANLFNLFNDGFGPHKISIDEVRATNTQASDTAFDPRGDNTADIDANQNTVLNVLALQILATYFCYITGKFACKIMIQGFSYAFPVNLTTPLSITLMIAACGVRNADPCFFHGYVPDYLFFESPSAFRLDEFFVTDMAWVWLLWLLSQAWITIHVWTPKCERLASTEKLFVSPMYTGLLIDQSMVLNRRRDDQADVKTEELADIGKEKGDEYYETISVHTDATTATRPKSNIKNSDHITRIYACATMWHENKEEMIEFLKSIIRLDEDQCARRVAQKYLRVVDPDYYEFETHIFFDDAFEISDHSDNDIQVNRFVKLLVATIDDAASDVHHTTIRVRPPKKYPAPYGGRLVWTLPGKTKMIAHLKDKDRIRHRKRWSQVMYMYYLLGHRLMDLPIPVDRKDVVAENTYLLTLDGDIDFQPKAVTLLIDLMKKNRNLGAACGRIHPIGAGPMVWYQMFEYAIGHWLQKATEHMIGCVLCSPGCFSLFRGKALMDDSVMKKYTTRSDQARHYVQYDQGEDRWLCTLLLQRGYRVEYSAASDSYTHAPEGFTEFYNQRRRWVPSTIANILDLLGDSKRTIKINDNISLLYIFYQLILMVSTILGPGTIFLMLVGAFVAAFKIDNWTAFHYNIVPILLFMVVCFTCTSNIQVIVAQLLSTMYALIMMAVIVGTSLQLGEDGVGSPSAIFLIALSGSFFIAACLHPQEFWCITAGLIYLLAIPSMYLLLILYSIINLNVVSWGTREVVAKKTKKEMEQEKKEMAEAAKQAKQKSLLGFLQGGAGSNADEEGSIEFSLAGLFRCILCTHGTTNNEKAQLGHIADSLAAIQKKIDSLERIMDPPSHRRRTTSGGSRENQLGSVAEGSEDDSESSDSELSTVNRDEQRDFLTNPYWIEDQDLRNGEVDFLSSSELQFWKDLIDAYLYPIDSDKAEQARIAADLKELRNSSVFAFFMVNALFVLIVFLMQLNKDKIHVVWPYGGNVTVTYDEATQAATVTKEYLLLEPIGMVFVFFFALILLIQFTAMLFHRFGTISHILSNTDLGCSKKTDELTQDALIDKHAVEIVKNLQRLSGIDGDYDNDSGSGSDRIARRRTVFNLEKASKPRRQIGTLDVAFKKRFMKLTAAEASNTASSSAPPMLPNRMAMRSETIRALEVRKNSIMAERNRSSMQTLGANSAVNPSLANEQLGLPIRNGRVSNAGINIQTVFNPNGGLSTAPQIYGHTGSGSGSGTANGSFEGDGDGNSLRMNPRNQVSWSNRL